jgi:PTH1 family peptidyl-tRNA hydrolase
VGEAWLVAGLGNPGERYATTRHNIGAMVTARLAGRREARFRKARFVPLLVAEARSPQGDVLLLTAPGTYMNESGSPMASFARRRGVPVERVIACHDEIDLPFGALRVKRGGSTAGHHGLVALVEAVRSADFYRGRLGVGRPPGKRDPIGYVLEPFATREREVVDLLVEDAADAVLSLVADGLEPTQLRFNRSAPPAGR